MARERREFSFVEVLVVVTSLGILATLLTPALIKVKGSAGRTKCAGNLRQLALAAIQYADDKRFFPHVGSLRALDERMGKNTPIKIRSLVWYGYHDNPEGFICPVSFDSFYPVTNSAVVNAPRRWLWGGADAAPSDRSPFVSSECDVDFAATDELSYGWTILGLNTGARSTKVLGADRSLREAGDGAHAFPARRIEVGNHDDGYNVVYVDGTVEFVSASYDPGVAGEWSVGGATHAGAWLRSSEKAGGFLDIHMGPPTTY